MVIFGLTFAVTMWLIALSYGLISKAIKARAIRVAPDSAIVAVDRVDHVHTFCPWCYSDSCKLRLAPFDLTNPFLAIVECRRRCGYKLSSGGKRNEKDATIAVTVRHPEQELAQTNIAQPAIAVVCCGHLAFLRRLGLQAGSMAGHSFGEYTALYAAGAISEGELLRLAILRGHLMANACGEKQGGMAAVKASHEEVSKWLGDGRVRIANHNSPSQTVISGPSEALEEVIKALRAA